MSGAPRDDARNVPNAGGPQRSNADAYDLPQDAHRDGVHDDALAREEERFGGFKFGSAFFGWLTATGTAVLLTALIAAIGAGIGFSGVDAGEAVADNPGAAGIVSLIVLVVVLLVSYFAGGYVAGRMARFSGAKQGVAVWIWAIVIAVVIAIVTAVAGGEWETLSTVDSLPRIPITPEAATLTGVLTALGAAIVALIGAILGGMAGMRYHRRVDRVGLGA